MPSGAGSVRPDVSIVSSGHDVADARLHREAAALQRAGLTVEVLALGTATDGPPAGRIRTWSRTSLLSRAGLALSLPWRARGGVVIALDPDSAVGAWLRRAAGRALPGLRTVRIVADVHEDYRLLLQDRQWARGARRLAGTAWARLGEFAARRADVTVVADLHLLPGIPGRVVFRNVPDLAMLPDPFPADDTPRALYVGDLRRSRGLFAMLDALAIADGWLLDLVGPVRPADVPELQRRLDAEPDLARRVRLHGRQPPREAWRLARGAWAGLLLLEDTPAFVESVPSKLYEYLACGLPVLSTRLPRVATVLAETGAGVVIDDAEAAGAALVGWSEQPQTLRELRRSALEAGKRFVDESGEFVAACLRLTARPDGTRKRPARSA